MVRHVRRVSDDRAVSLPGAQSMLMLALRIAIAWTVISLLCVALWVVSLEAGRLFGSTRAGKFRGKTATGF